MGGDAPKQFRVLAGVPMLLRSLRPFAQLPDVLQIVVPLPRTVLDSPPEWLRDALGDRVRAVEGGATRTDSVANGVRALDPDCRIVLIHDAARPLVSQETVLGVIAHRPRTP